MKRLSVGIVSERRWREEMQDAHCVVPNFTGKKSWLFGGVFDGHRGSKVANGLSNYMADFVRKMVAVGEQPRDAQKLAYKKAARAEWAQENLIGSCMATFIVHGKNVSCANVGDCRIIVLGKFARQLTRDHNLKDEIEARRINKRGTQTDRDGYIWCGDDGLNMTRAIGDLNFRKVGLLSTPFTSKYLLKQTDRFIVAASDGLFGEVSNATALVLSRRAKTAEELAQMLEQEVELRRGPDNLTIIVVQI